nr:hypothetical protein B0A51_07585 [Rachicladosporium sp. CCFEE 5018]OQO30180.1 hypothetical protein B0A51_03524 [Rachicladosporium sp. CCFEE 5018]
MNVRPEETKVFQHIKHGDMAAVQRSLTSGELTVHDYDTFGNSVLDYAATSRNADYSSYYSCAFERDDNGRTALHWLAHEWARTDYDDHSKHEEVMLELLARGSNPSAHDSTETTPLWNLLDELAPVVESGHHGSGTAQQIIDVLQQWTRIFQASGQSLQSYTASEQQHHIPLHVKSFRLNTFDEAPPPRVSIDQYDYDAAQENIPAVREFTAPNTVDAKRI